MDKRAEPTVEGMDKATRENQALRAASEAVKMMALSQGVMCPYNIPTFADRQCVSSVRPLINEPPEMQYKRSLAFFRAIQQGVNPSICQKALPQEEEDAFIKEWREVLVRYHAHKKSLKQGASEGISISDWTTENLFHLPKMATGDILIAFRNFVTGGNQIKNKPNPLTVHGCQFLGHPVEYNYGRFIELITLTPEKLAFFFEKEKYALTDPTQLNTHASVTAGTSLNNITITVVHNMFVSEKGTDKKDYLMIPSNGADAMVPITDSFYILANSKVHDATSGQDWVQGATVLERRLIAEIFKGDGVDDVQPWLMYLLMTTPATYEAFMKGAFGGRFSPPLKFKLAYYIVAHYVATHDPAYKENPSIFYKLPDSEKIPKMIAALKKEKCIQDDLLTTGYRWLNRESVKEVRPSMKELIDTRFGSGLGALKLKGGKRQTRKVRFRSLDSKS